ncbi:MAG: hypothetical protein STSR0008_14420 [Ignavibacterium sp.]
MKKLLFFNIILFLLSIFFYSCDYFESDNDENISQLEINLNGLPTLPLVTNLQDSTKMDTLIYVGWLTSDNGVSTKTIRINSNDIQNGSYFNKFDFNLGPIQNAQLFNLTIERLKNDSTPVSPSNLIVFSGRFSYSGAKISINKNDADLLNISGIYNLATPTDGNNDINEKSGIWFVDSISTVGGPKQGLKLPELYNGWIYVGWVKIGDHFISTGKFQTTVGADLNIDDITSYGGNSPGFSFPGEDFLNNAPTGLIFPLDLSGSSVFISIEPNLNIKFLQPSKIILQADIPNDVQSRVSYTLQKTNLDFPNGYLNAIIDIVK